MALELYADGYEIDGALPDMLYRRVLEFLGLEDCFDVEVSVVDEETIRELNARTRDTDRVTDVLSFPNLEIRFPFCRSDYAQDVNPDSGNLMLGDIVLCAERARQQAEEYGHSYRRECGYLVLHGLLHLFGYDHEDEQDRARMRAAEEAVLKAADLPRE